MAQKTTTPPPVSAMASPNNHDTSSLPGQSSSSNKGPRFFSTTKIPVVTLHNGVEMPVLQLGTAQLINKTGLDKSLPHADRFKGMLPERGYRQIQIALEQGLRAFDSAHIYRSGKALGAVLGTWWQQHHHQNSRQEVWLQSKIFHPNVADFGLASTHMPQLHEMTTNQVTEMTTRHFEAVLQDLGVGYIDCMMLHWPSGLGQGTRTENRQRRIAAWRVLEQFYARGWTRAIGVSNFTPRHLEQLMQDGATIKPMVNQFEASITCQYTDILEYCQQHNIVPQAFSPLGRGQVAVPGAVTKLAHKYNKDIGQIAFRYLYQLGYAVVFLSNSERRMVTNTDIFDFTLTEPEMHELRELNRESEGSWGLSDPHLLD